MYYLFCYCPLVVILFEVLRIDLMWAMQINICLKHIFSEEKSSEWLNVKKRKRLESTSNIIRQQHDVFPFMHTQGHTEEEEEKCLIELYKRYICYI